jgi:NAD(P)-dependent dehydrogenase (short-subunit alcohol dehydrogenase family)
MKTVLITGAGSGIGRLTARRFLDAGWQVGLIGRRESALTQTAAGDAGALVLPCDVTDPQAMDLTFARAAAAWGRLDVLFNNAGAMLISRLIDEISWEDWQGVTRVNVDGMFLCARAAFRQMRRQQPMGRRIINNGSIAATAPRPGSVPYTVSKHAVTGLTRTLALDGRAFNIACGQIDAGNAATEMISAVASLGAPQAGGEIRVEPLMDAAHVAEAVFQMASLLEGANVLHMTLMATNMPFVGRG